jgi:hypothetical protein
MKVHNAICSCSNELYKQRFTLTDFLPNWDISRGFLSVYIIYNAGGISAAIRELYCTFADFLQNWNFPLNNINFADRNSEAAMGRVGSGGFIFLGCRVG